MRAIVKAGHRSLAAFTETILKERGYKFIVNGGGDVIEFELQSPRCIVSVRDASGVTMKVPLWASTRTESVIEIRRMIGSSPDGAALAAAAKEIAGALSAEYPKLKWKGSGDLG